jgi:hypothetical protein
MLTSLSQISYADSSKPADSIDHGHKAGNITVLETKRASDSCGVITSKVTYQNAEGEVYTKMYRVLGSSPSRSSCN